jgi:hypothetical protein
MTYCGLVCGYQYFGGLYCPHVQSKNDVIHHKSRGIPSLEILVAGVRDVIIYSYEI